MSLKTRQRKRFKIGDLFALSRSIAVVDALLKVLVGKTCWGRAKGLSSFFNFISDLKFYSKS